ncbi:MAG: 2-amino-4-hydroxy-6-hydroxymethyldihydropteridine diphosphokinase [Planctomycetia bacterium]|nr:2-amino-4-hydroxy-6-hydroxymethyldihydropteridine diphosphokinase [Planctomycetia bacterium]
MPRALLALGANQGDRAATLAAALESLASQSEIREISRSSWRETAPIGGPSAQTAFLNGASLIETSLSPHDLWKRLADTETDFGRRRTEHWGARTLDLDLLLYEEQVVDDDVLTVPHPLFALRRFVLEPAAEIAGSMLHPTLGCTIEEIWRHVQVAPQEAKIIGGSSEDRAMLAARIALHGEAWLLTNHDAIHPRLTIELHDLGDTSPDERRRVLTRWDDGLVLQADTRNLNAAAREAVLAMQGLAD